MQEKQIIIDGVNVNALSLNQIARMSRYEVAHLFIKLVECINRTEDDYNKAQEDRVKMWTDNTDLTEQLKRKEQECEELRKEIAFGNNGTLSDKIRAIVFKDLNKENNKLSKTLTEIKEIAESCSFTDSSELLLKRIKVILQKISECEVNNERQQHNCTT